MAGLLSGIRFIPKPRDKIDCPASNDARDSSSDSGDNKKKKKKSQKHSSTSGKDLSSRKSDKSKRKRKHQDGKKVLEYSIGRKDKRSPANRSRSSSSSEADEARPTDPRESCKTMQEIDYERFSKAIDGAEMGSSGESGDERDAWGARVVRPILRQDFVAATVVPSPASQPARVDENRNQSVAALLRARLKASNQSLPPSAASTAASIVVDTDPYSIAKRLLNRRRKAEGGDEISSNAPSKRARPTDEPLAASSLTQMDMFAMKAEERWNERSMDDIFVSNVLRLGDNYKGTELGGGVRTEGQTGFDEEDEIDMKMFQSSDDRITAAERASRDQRQAEREHTRLESIQARCVRCIDCTGHDKRLTVSVGEHAYLRVKPSHLCFVPWGQCEIIPILHCSSTLRAGEDALTEIARYKSCLERMFEREGKTIVYLESAVKQKSVVRGKSKQGLAASDNSLPSDLSRHTVIDVVPVKEGELKAVMSYFRECDVEWSTHKKLIDLSCASGSGESISVLHKKVPAHMNYVAAEWPGGGFAHVVEDEELFNDDFCLDVMSGFFEDVPFHMKRRQHADAAADLKILSAFKDSWSTFDWVAYSLQE